MILTLQSAQFHFLVSEAMYYVTVITGENGVNRWYVSKPDGKFGAVGEVINGFSPDAINAEIILKQYVHV